MIMAITYMVQPTKHCCCPKLLVSNGHFSQPRFFSDISPTFGQFTDISVVAVKFPCHFQISQTIDLPVNLIACLSIVQLIAVGPTTAAEMTVTLGRVDGTAARPDPQHVCHIVTRLSSQHTHCSHTDTSSA